MKQLISNMKNIPGVVGVAVFKDDGALTAFDFPEAYDRNLLDMLGSKFQPIKEILPEDEGEIVYLCWEFEALLGFYYPVTGGWVNIVSSDDIPMPVFSLTMTAVANKLPALLADAAPLAADAAPPPAEAKPAVMPESDDLVPMDKMEELEKLFSFYMGPAAPVMFKRGAKSLGFTLETCPVNMLKPLLEGVLAKVPDNKKTEVGEKINLYL